MISEKELLDRITTTDAFIKAWHNALDSLGINHEGTVIDRVDFDGKEWHVAPKECDHKWVKYQGFTDSYEYCEICDEKKEKA